MKPALIVAAAALLAAPVNAFHRPEDRRARICERPAAASLDSLLSQGRWWHASRLLPAPAGTRRLPAESVVVFGSIAEGLGEAARVEALLRRARGGDSLPSFLALAARADERAERWAAAARRYRQLLALEATPGELRQTSAVRLALVLERSGPRDSALAAWRRAAQEAPEVADWLAIRRAHLEPDTALAFAAVSASQTPGARQRADVAIAQRRLEAGNRQAALELMRLSARPLELARAEIAAGRRRQGRSRADSMLFADPTRPNGFLAAVFLTEHFDSLTLAEALAVSRAYRARLDYAAAERFARQAVAGADSSVTAWLELATVQSLRRGRAAAALQSLDQAERRAGTRRAALVGAARVRVLAQLGQEDRAEALLEELIRGSRGDTAVARVVLLRADRHRATAERARETARYLTLLRRFPNAPATVVASFRLGLMRYVEGDRDSAAVLVGAALARDSAGALGLSARYWDARLRFERGDTSGAAALRQLAAQWPISFHGTRARELLGDTAFVVDTAIERPRPGSFPPARARERIRLLALLGLDAEARAEAVAWAGDTTASIQLLMAAAQAAGEAGLARESIALGEAARLRAGMLPGVARALFPLPYRTVIEAEAAEHCVDPLLMAAIIRQESRFDPRAISLAGAYGLSQIWVPTGREMAQRLRLGPFSRELLHVPDYNLHLGSRYVQERAERDALPPHALFASYNGGPTRVRRWRAWPEFDDPDLFAERVYIAETQNYVRIVYASHAWYRAAYLPAAAPAAPPERLVP